MRIRRGGTGQVAVAGTVQASYIAACQADDAVSAFGLPALRMHARKQPFRTVPDEVAADGIATGDQRFIRATSGTAAPMIAGDVGNTAQRVSIGAAVVKVAHVSAVWFSDKW